MPPDLSTLFNQGSVKYEVHIYLVSTHEFGKRALKVEATGVIGASGDGTNTGEVHHGRVMRLISQLLSLGAPLKGHQASREEQAH